MRTAVFIVLLGALLTAGLAGGWAAMNYYAPGSAGTPAHAGAISQGKPEQCTNVNFNVRARDQEARSVLLNKGDLVRGTFEVDGGFGEVDIFLRIVSPQGLDLLATPRVDHYDFTLPAQIRGEYQLVFDNRFSLYTSKSVGLYYCVDPQP
jgi:hypothetical protein